MSIATLDTTAREAFLQKFPNEWRSHIANTFLQAARAGAARPGNVIKAVETEARRRIIDAQRWGDDANYHKFDMLLAHLDTGEALDYAAWCLHYESLSPKEKERLKATKRDEHVQAYMQSQPPTTAQLNLLSRLRWHGSPPVNNRAEASALIDSLMKGIGRG